jgi:hypothetical protein
MNVSEDFFKVRRPYVIHKQNKTKRKIETAGIYLPRYANV